MKQTRLLNKPKAPALMHAVAFATVKERLVNLTRQDWHLPPVPTAYPLRNSADLQNFALRELQGTEIILASQREPYAHHEDASGVRVEQPAGGLVTALEPVMNACAGTWIAHGSGSADWDMVTRHDHVKQPPPDTHYTLRRLRMSQDEITGHYQGLCNEGLWPLCNQAHVRPVFRWRDWKHYQAVNRRFCDAVVQEAQTPDPLVLVQDYHLALVPSLLRRLMPDACISMFWHIPWPHPKAFAMCPWRNELLQGMLGADLLGFQTQLQLRHFSQTMEQLLQARFNPKTQMLWVGQRHVQLRAYPISIAWPDGGVQNGKTVAQCRRSVRIRHQFAPDIRLGLGVDRLDYVKGILERFTSIEHLLEWQPQWIGHFSFLQVIAPSRQNIAAYQDYLTQIKRLTAHINQRFGSDTYTPIKVLYKQKSAQQLLDYYRACDVCYVSSLDDGMNLVAKEFVAARDDLQGVLVLSEFAGAATELPQALIVNPYDASQCAHTLAQALTMPSASQRERMQHMRNQVAEHNVFRWAGNMLEDAVRIRRRAIAVHEHAA